MSHRRTERVRAAARLRALLQLLVLASSAVLLVACSGGNPSATSSADPFGRDVAAVLALADAGGASEAQVAILYEAREAGVLEFEPYKAAIDATFECFREHGLEYHSSGVDTSLGFPSINYSVEGPESGPLPDATACEQEHSAYVAELYQTQPVSAEASDQRFLDAQPLLIPCLEKSGFLTIPEPTPDEVRDAIWAGFDAVENGTAPAGFDPTTCLTEAGITAGSF